MNVNTILWALFISLGYAAWPIVGKRFGAPGVWMGTVVNFCGLACMLACSARELKHGPGLTFKALIALLCVGILNGIAVYIYSLKTTDKNIPTGSFITLVSVALITFAPLLDYMMNNTMLSGKQGLGIVVGWLAIYLISGK